MIKYTLEREGNYYRGNLHTHSTVSDGGLTPEELKELYKKFIYERRGFSLDSGHRNRLLFW